MITIRHHIIGAVCLMAGMTACTDLEEKVYDRNTSIETLKFIVSNGYEIKKKS